MHVEISDILALRNIRLKISCQIIIHIYIYIRFFEALVIYISVIVHKVELNFRACLLQMNERERRSIVSLPLVMCLLTNQ